MPEVTAHLLARRPDFVDEQGETLGAKLRRRRRELGLRRVDAAKLLGVDPKTLMWWERDERLPVVSAYPEVIKFLGYAPWDEPQSLAEALLAERRRRGLGIARVANLIGVDESTWLRWEQGQWKPTRWMVALLSRLLGIDVGEVFPGDVR